MKAKRRSVNLFHKASPRTPKKTTSLQWSVTAAKT